jgi:competence protein ComEC
VPQQIQGVERAANSVQTQAHTRLFHSNIAISRSLGLLLCFAAAAWAAPISTPSKALLIFFVDVEGGQATPFVTPAHQLLLIDTGWPDHDGRDADRIVAAAKLAGMSKIDYVLITHFHADRVGGVPQLAARIPIGRFIDHGVNRKTTDPATQAGWQAYQEVLATGSSNG